MMLSISPFFYEASDASRKNQLAFCMEYINENEEICEESLKFVHGTCRLTDKGSFKKTVDILN